LIFLTLLYNALLAGAGFHVLRRAPRTATFLEGLRAAALVLVSSLLLAFLLGIGNHFRVMGLLANGIFLHLPVALLIVALQRRKSPRSAAALATLAAGLVGVAVFSFLIEPFRLEVTKIRLHSPKVKVPIRIALVSDLQTDVVSEYEREVLAGIMAEAPDLILLSGDYVQIVDDARRREVQAELRKVLREVGFGAPLGVFAVAGNVDSPDWPRMFEGLPVTVVESTSRIELPGITLTALNVWESFDAKIHIPEADSYHVVLGHSPDYALGDVSADLLLAGHTHGGQVRLPFLGPILTLARIPRSWAAGATELPGGRTLVVSRGIGMERGPAPRLRFLCRPELALIEIHGVGDQTTSSLR
jgi:predicted MPP superfamily phosphohydrolase